MTSALRGEGVPSKADIVSNLSEGGCGNLRTRGEGVENFADILNGSVRRENRAWSPQAANLPSLVTTCYYNQAILL